MPLIRKIIKKDRRDVIVKWTGSGTDTITLADLAATGQTLTGVVNPAASITGVSTSVSGAGDCTIARNSENAFHVHDNFEFQSDGVIQAVVDENATSSIVVTLANTGTLIIKLRKTQGYSEE
jgi:hypothetical protein